MSSKTKFGGKNGKKAKGRKFVSKMVKDEENESSTSSGEEEEEEIDDFEEDESEAGDVKELPSEYWQIQKLVQYIKIGNPTATVLALCAMRDCTFEERVCLKALKETGGLEMTLNLLETGILRCQIASVKLILKLAPIPAMRCAIVDLEALESLKNILSDPSLQLRRLVAEAISILATYRKAYRIVRKTGAISYLVDLLDIPESVLCYPQSKMSFEQKLLIEGAQYGAKALWSLSISSKNKQCIWNAGAVPLLGRLLKSIHVDMLIPVIGTIQECAVQENYRLAVRELEMLDDIQNHLKNTNVQLKQYCAAAVFQCAIDAESRDYIGKQGGLKPLVATLNSSSMHSNVPLMRAVTGAIWKCALSEENVKQLKTLGAVQALVPMLTSQPEEVLVNVVGALGLCATLSDNSQAIRKAGGIEPLVRLLSRTKHDLIVNVTQAVGACAKDPDNMIIIEKMDGVRLVWSHVKSDSYEVQASAAWALCPCVMNVKDSADMVRSFVGGLELIVNLLHSPKSEVLIAVCAAIACIAKDEENLAVLTDYNIVKLLSHLANTKVVRLQHRLAEAIAACCPWSKNRIDFGHRGVVVPLVNFLKSDDFEVRCASVHALYQLSMEPINCATMHTHGVVKSLLKMVEITGEKEKDREKEKQRIGKIERVQESAAGCLQNIRRLALTKERRSRK